MRSDSAITLTWSDPVTGEPFEEVVALPATIGRAADNTVVLTSAMISRHHATLGRENGAIVLADSSSNGTFVNGERQRRAVLANGDTFQIGPYQLSMREHATIAPGVTLAWTDPASGQARQETFTLPLVIGRGSASGLVLRETEVSRSHATIADEGGSIIVTDSSSNGTFINGQRQQRATLRSGDQVRIGTTTLAVTLGGPAARTAPRAIESSIDMESRTMLPPHPSSNGDAPGAATMPPGAPPAGAGVVAPARAREDATVLGAPASQRQEARSFPPPVFNEQYVSVAALQQTGHPVYTTTYAALGGGWGSFIFADHLAIWGVDPSQIIALGIYPEPFRRYLTLARNSQIPLHERLRSDSSSRPDNIWGTPGYAAQESWKLFWSGHWGQAIHWMWQVWGEPSVSQTYTPRAGDVFTSAAREARRIGWEQIWRFGRVRAIRKTDDGRYAIAYSQSDDQRQSYAFLVAPYVQLSTGYPALQFLPDLQEYRVRTGDFEHVVNGYEPHDFVYERLEQQGGVVLLRGRGIVASRLIQRLYEARQKNPNIAILHLMRTPITKGHTFRRAQRKVVHHVELQAFNWPKGTWGGQQREILRKASEEERQSLYADWGGTTTARRGDWIRIIDQGMREGWYKIEFGDVTKVDRAPDGRLVTHVAAKGPIGGTMELVADYIIDATGLDAKVNRNSLLQDTVDHYGLYVNKLGRLGVSNDMEVVGMRNGNGRFFAAGSMTLGGPLAGIDTFLGMQAAASLTVEHLAHEGAPGLKPMNPFRSFSQWLKWCRGVKP